LQDRGGPKPGALVIQANGFKRKKRKKKGGERNGGLENANLKSFMPGARRPDSLQELGGNL